MWKLAGMAEKLAEASTGMIRNSRNQGWLVTTRLLGLGLLCLAPLLSLKAESAEGRPNKPLRIGALFSLSGYGVQGGTAELNGALLAVEEINSSGGVQKRKIELVTEDFRSDLRSVATAMQKLASVDEVPVVLGPNWSEFSEVAASIAQQHKVVGITASGYTPTLTKDREYFFSALERHSALVEPLCRYISVQKPKKLAALVMENSFHQSIFSALKQQLTEMGIDIWRVDSITSGTKDFRASIARMKAAGVDGVIIMLLHDGTDYAFLKQARELKLGVPIYSGNSILFDPSFKQSPEIAEGVVLFDYSIPSSNDFLERYRSRFKSDPLPNSARVYDLVFAIKQAAERCGDSSEQIRRCLAEGSYEGISGRIEFDSDRNLKITAPISKLFRMTDGRPVELKL
jgi:branched-chain amino acid transport system substrate-binding protein